MIKKESQFIGMRGYAPTNHYTPENSKTFDFSDNQNLLRYHKLLAQSLFGGMLAKNYDNVCNDTTIRQRTKYKKVKSIVQAADVCESSRG